VRAAGGELTAARDRSLPEHAVPFGARGWSSYVTGDRETGAFTTDWVALPEAGSSSDLAVFVAGRAAADENELLVQYADAQTATALAPTDIEIDRDAWTAHPLALTPPAGADRMRLVGIDRTTDLHGWLAVSAPLQAPVRPLTSVLAAHEWTALSSPQFRAYLPCVRDPLVRGGIAEPPDVVLSDGALPLMSASPFRNVTDAHEVVGMPYTTPQTGALPELYFVDRTVPGSSLVPAADAGDD
jgi:hypothetical protein